MNDAETTASGDPLWYKDAIIYQLHIKSFFDGNNDGIGDFAGLHQKLDYIASLGVTAIWLLPFYPSPRRDDGYDIADYTNVSPDYGTMEDFRSFVTAAHARDLKVITELVINHTSDQHPWFQRARHAPAGSPERDFYVWSDTDQKFPETRIIFIDTEKSNWTFDPVGGAFFWHRFYSHQPDLNFDNPEVLKSLLEVMHFWLETGIDGFRLDAIPYLIEREGTINENLPETHTILKAIRAELDAAYPGKMLLAEANQWPEDTREYFGDGDECHMAFHFPLMPRMYMAIAKEDRFPITDILRQTPDIPANAQWAIFLRNHDELTLEMVTDAERDYLWNTYAADKRARINLGIRRRLAPLMERDRRRVELMNALLLSMPGTPVLYYGDEIGMGDNIYLGDRDGVRTPMQWASDRNGGFSRADPARLVLPPVMDHLYGYQTLNVEAQSDDAHSQLNWTRRMLTLRRHHAAFGRGTIRFLSPSNRKILAYLREYGEETILCVANLSRLPQALELDLANFEGRVPVEMTGMSPFPPIGKLTYLLTLQPYGFFWFQLMTESAGPSWRTAPPEQLPDFTTFVVRRSVAELVEEERHAAVLTRDILPAYLELRRWFAAKDKVLHKASIASVVAMPFAQGIFLGELLADFADHTERYFLPLAVAWDDKEPPTLAKQLALARIRLGRRVGFVTDGFALEGLARGIMKALAERTSASSDAGTIDFIGTDLLDQLGSTDDLPIRWLSAEQSNSSLLIDDVAMVKLIRHVVEGVHPEAEMTRYLTSVGYKNTAPLLGEVVRTTTDGKRTTIAIVQGSLRNQGDAWSWMRDNLKRAADELALVSEDAPARDDPFRFMDNLAGIIGQRLGELHGALARPTDDEDFAPRRATAEDANDWRTAVTERVTGTLDTLATARDGLDLATQDTVDGLLRRRDSILAAVRQLAESGIGSLMTRTHGDFHLGQVLVAEGDAYIIDFEGEPLRTIDERRAKTSPLRDVAGLLRSLDYVVASVDLDPPPIPDQKAEKRPVLLRQFAEEATASFLRSYADAAGGSSELSADSAARDRLIDLFLLEKAAYEVSYEVGNRPTWLPVPLRGFSAIVDRLLEGER